jgi:hypothetical protein
MSALGNSQRKWPSNNETHNKPPITAASGIIVHYVSWKKKSGVVVMFPFFSSNVTANDGSFWCLMTEIQKLRSSRQVFFKVSFEVSFEVLRSFLGKTSKLPSKIFIYLEKNWKFYSNYQKILLFFFSKMRNFPDSHSFQIFNSIIFVNYLLFTCFDCIPIC